MGIDREKVIKAIVDCEVAPTNREEGARLVEEFLNRLDSFPDTRIKSLGVEVPWYVELGKKMYAVGQVDRILVGGTICEWKTKGAPKLKKDGTPYLGQDEDSWLAEIGSGAQLVTYAMGARYGKFIDLESVPLGPDVFVRACVKSTPPDFWPSNPAKGVFSFTDNQVNSVFYAYSVIGEMLRSARKSGKLPWAIPGEQCVNKYRRECSHLPQCSKQVYPEVPVPSQDDIDDPSYRAIVKALNLDLADPELVVLSYSSYSKFIECPEKFRREWGGKSSEDSSALEIGKVYHAGLRSIYEQLM